ncbi:autotransporter domain-containing protein [Fusobacterium perfoetens]|uniref:autotransporter outer membrane beta-barrel domain-containing protein n=1 Tax=Fusobacterium perfoetens TaxID=852 RepID=UPI001F3436EF|nr:autotransporter outer membrane beta-barrel domain-containing protein [Fusobacterium perfoetens]MCF2625991.1 autotransporter domain-containing protein [Fusobacterium perfoetens]
MGKNYVESSLKRFLKRKVKITLGLVVAFMITGGVSFGIKGPFVAHDNDGTNYQVKKLEDENITITGGLIGLEYGTVSKYGQAGATGSILALNGGTVNIGNEKTKKINLISTGIYAQTLSSDNSYGSSETGKGGIINVITDELNIEAHGKKGKSNYAIGIYALNRSTKASSENVSKIIINSKKTTINCTIEEGRSSGIQAWSQGQVFINEGTLEVKADDIIKTRGKSLVQLNAKNNSQNTMKLDGDINFAYNATQSGTTVDSDIIINLSNKDSYFNGKIYSSGNPTAGKSIVNGMKLGLYNGGTWNVTGDSFANEIVIKDGGKISFGNGEDKTLEMWNREEATDKLAAYDKGIQMQGGAIIEGNGNIVAYDLDLTGNTPETESLTKTVYGNAITVTNKGNILALGKDSSITGNVLIETGAELTNKGMFKVVGTTDKEVVLTNKGTINLASGTSVTLGEKSSFENKKGATLNVESGATAVTGGTTTNNGVISLKDTDNSDKTVSKLLAGGTLTNEGTIALADRAEAMTDENWNKLLETLITDKGTFTNKGMVVDKAGNSIFSAGTTIESGTAGELLESGVAGSGETIKIEDKQDGTTITGSTSQEGIETTTDTLKDITVNVEGNLNLAEGSGAGVVMEDVTMNVSSGKNVTATGEGHKLSGNVVLNGESSIVVGDGKDTSDSNLTLSGAVSQGAVEENKAAKIEVKENGTLNLVDATVNVAINSDATGQTGAVTSKGETSIKDITAKSLDIKEAGKEVNITTIDGNVNIGTITVGDSINTKGEKTNILVLSADTVLGTPSSTRARLFRAPAGTSTNTIKIGGENGQLALELGENGKNALGNSSGIEIIGTSTDKNNKDLLIKTAGLSGKENTINLGDNKFEKVGVTSDSKIYLLDTILNENAGDSNNTTVILKYNNELYKGNSILNNINAQAFDVSNFFSSDEAEREVQLDKIYSSNIYSETVKAAYDTVKMNEEAVLSLARKSEVGKWTAEGKALYSKDEYDRKGTVGEYSSEIESTGLMAAFGYGLNETTTAGIAFSGVKQDVDTDGGSADADLFYLGVYGNKIVGNYDFTAGLGYQFGEYEADNTITNVHGSDKYDSKALSGYVQGRYTADLGDGLSLQPRVRLGYTYVEQDDTRDSYFGVSDAEITTFDAEFGLDTVKSVQLEKSKVDVKFGVSYVRTMGDTDDEFTGRFYGATASEGFNVLGAELAENVVKFNLGAEVTNENGFFYNGGLTYEFGSNDTDVYGVNVGVGYKF